MQIKDTQTVLWLCSSHSGTFAAITFAAIMYGFLFYMFQSFFFFLN